MNRRTIHYIIASLLALVLLYVASSGPILRFVYRDKERYIPVPRFYVPMFDVAKPLHLLLPLGLYLRAWNIIVGIATTDGRMYIVPDRSMEMMKKRDSATPASTPAPAATATPAP